MPVTFPPLPTTHSVDPRIDVLKTLLSNADTKVNHIDSLRQRYITIALVIFAGLFGFGLKLDNMIAAICTTVALTTVAFIFCLLDRNLHRLSHGWRETCMKYTENIESALTDPTKAITVRRYVSEAESDAEPFSLQPVLYYVLIAGSFASIGAFALVGKW